MRQDDLFVLMQRDPCPLLRLHLTGGMSFDIVGPDLVVLTRSTVELQLPPHGSQAREAVISLLHIVWVEVISAES